MKHIKLFTIALGFPFSISVGVIALMVWIQPPVALASSYGCTFYGQPMWPSFARAQFCGKINGSGLNVQSIGGAYIAAGYQGWLSNSRVKVELLNDSGNVYKTYLSSVQTGRNSVGGWGWTIGANVQPGTARFTLLSNGAIIAVVERSIEP